MSYPHQILVLLSSFKIKIEFHYDLMMFLKLQVNIQWKIMFRDSPS